MRAENAGRRESNHMTVNSSPELVAILVSERLREAEHIRCADEAVRAMRCCQREPSLLERLTHRSRPAEPSR